MKTLNIKYHTLTQTRRLADKTFVLETIRSLDEAIDQVCEALTTDEQADPFAEDLCPYFGILWPAAEALSLYLADHPQAVRNKSVLELGCGLGFPSLVAAHLGGEVLATDFHPQVEDFFLRNCRHSSIDCSYQRLNWREEGLERQFDVVMGSDVLYESKHPQEVAKGLIRFVKKGGTILLADPGRNYLQKFIDAMKVCGFRETYELINVAGKEQFVFSFTEYTE